MGEILRATLEAECVTSRPKFYSGRMQMIDNFGGESPIVRSTFTTVDLTSWFLLTSFYVGAANVDTTAGSSWWGLQSFRPAMQLEDMTSRRQYYLSTPGDGGAQGLQIASYMASPVELSEYILFEPGTRIKWTVSMIPFFGEIPPFFFDICYGGIDYVMPKAASEYYQLDGG